MKEQRDLELLLTSHKPLIVIETIEEVRALQLFARLGLKLPRQFHQWTLTKGLQPLVIESTPVPDTQNPTDVLKRIQKQAEPGYFLLLDYHPFITDPLHIRLIKEIAQDFDNIPKTLIFLSHAFTSPPELRHLIARFDLRLPDAAGIRRVISEEIRRWQSRTGKRALTDPGLLVPLTRQLAGTTATDAHRIIRAAIENDGKLNNKDLPEVMKAKYQLFSEEGVISFQYDTASFKEVAGLNRLKQWLSHRHKAFTSPSPQLDAPKGVLLLGVQGGGKSLAAKAIAGTFGVPLLRLDFGVLYNKYYGETEKNLRHALKTAEIMAPCVLWIDELEKGIAPDSGQDGLSQRLLSTLLTWMAESHERVFIVATANDIQPLPPELLRKGRMDEIFFVDLPGNTIRREIFEIHLRQRNHAPSSFDLEALTGASEGFTGAEIEQAIVSARYTAQSDRQDLSTQYLLDELANTRPLSVVMSEQISALREWASGRTVMAD